jgi:tripeptide aminopeptidase
MDTAMRHAAREAGGSVDVSWVLEYEGFSVAPDDPAVLLVAAACGDVGAEPRLFATGGGSDANVLAALGVPTLVLACGMTKVHTVDEELPVAELDRLVELLGATVRRAAV